MYAKIPVVLKKRWNELKNPLRVIMPKDTAVDQEYPETRNQWGIF